MTESRFPPVALPQAPFARELQAFCLSFPGAYEDYPWGSVVYKVGVKMFATLGGEDGFGVTLKARPDDASVLVQLPGIRPAHYTGRYGWVTVDVNGEDSLDLARELIAASYELVAPKRLQRLRHLHG